MRCRQYDPSRTTHHRASGFGLSAARSSNRGHRARPIDLALVRAADRHLGDAAMLVEDAIDTLADAGQHSGELADALASLQDQRDQLIAALVALEAAQHQPRSSVSWMWAVVLAIAIVMMVMA